MSLKDQLVKSGLASKKQARKAGQEARQEQKQKTKKERRAEQAQKEAAFQEKLDAQREKDQALERERQAEQEGKDRLARVRQLIDANRQEPRGAEERYNFLADGRFVRYVYVSKKMAQDLERGTAGIVTTTPGEREYIVVDADTCRKLREIDAAYVVCLHEGPPEASETEAADPDSSGS